VIRVVLPAQLCSLAQIDGTLDVDAAAPTIAAVLDAIEARFPMLRGTIRDQRTLVRRPYVRFFACERDLSHDAHDALLPLDVVEGREPLLVVGAIAGG
jgi:sulfur-carrier protein